MSKATRRDILKGGAAAGLAGMMVRFPGLPKGNQPSRRNRPMHPN